MPDTISPNDIATAIDPVDALLDALAAKRAEAADYEYEPPAMPPEPPAFGGYNLRWKEAAEREEGEAVDLDAMREMFREHLRGFIHDDGRERVAMLANIAAGGGKTYAGVVAAQEAARAGLRVAWAAGRHDAFRDLQNMPIFDPALWYEWMPMWDAEMYGDRFPTTCIYMREQREWMQKGYPAAGLCWQLCGGLADYMNTGCDYRMQKTVVQPIVFIMHQHLSHGITTERPFDLVIVDELPLNAFVTIRDVPPEGIVLGSDASGPVRELISLLEKGIAECGQENRELRGKDLLDRIGDTLRDCYAQLDILKSSLPKPPLIRHPADVQKADYWYIADFLIHASNEYDAWKVGHERWPERVWLDASGLHILKRADEWKEIPGKMIVLDATGKREIYEQIFPGWEFEEYRPRIRRRGKLYQIPTRLNGKGTLLNNGSVTENAEQLIEQARLIAGLSCYQGGKVRVITHQGLEPAFADEFGEANVAHFYNVRGSNAFEDSGCTIIAGAPAPSPLTVIQIATALHPERRDPFPLPADAFSREWRSYNVTEDVRANSSEYGAPADGMIPEREVSGYWSEPILQAIYDQLREREIEQALHRSRINARGGEDDINDVWLLSSIPTHEPVDGIWSHLSACQFACPDSIPWGLWAGKIRPYIDNLDDGDLDYDTLATLTGRSRDYIQGRKWLSSILEYLRRYDDREWIETSIRPAGGRGRGKKGIRSL